MQITNPKTQFCLLLATFALLSATPTLAQTAAELLVVSSISAKLDSSISLPSGAFYVASAKVTQQFTAMLAADQNKYDNYQLHVANGLAKKLAQNFVGQLETNFATAGYWKTTTSSATVGNETRVRSEFSNDDNGKTLLLFVVYRSDSVYFLVGKKK